jgi:hypothetical protein
MRYKRLPVPTHTPRLSLEESARSQTLPQANSRGHASLETIIDCTTAIIILGRSYRNGTVLPQAAIAMHRMDMT